MSGRRFIIQDWDGNAVIRGSWRKAKAENRRINQFSYCATVKVYRGPLPTGTVLTDGRNQGYRCTFREASKLAQKLIKDGVA